MFTSNQRRILMRAGIIIDDNIPEEKQELIQIGMELQELDRDDILKIIDTNTTYSQAEKILTTNRKADVIKKVTPKFKVRTKEIVTKEEKTDNSFIWERE